MQSASLLDVVANPDIIFVSEALRLHGDTWRLPGTVTAHGNGVAVEVSVDQVRPEPGGVRMHARAKHLHRYAFGVTKARGIGRAVPRLGTRRLRGSRLTTPRRSAG